MFMYECGYGRNDLSSYYTPHYKLPGVMYAYVIISTIHIATCIMPASISHSDCTFSTVVEIQ